jgi:natural product biosynthesis luciferase-like monooxygenase protein
MVTERIQIRAGSVVLPLHNPIRVAEEWSVVDNLSKGRVGVAFASGWHPGDFTLAPGLYHERKEVMFRQIEAVRKLWAGESIALEDVDGQAVEVKILPRPIQPTLPVWITIAGNSESYRKAGAIGAHVLTGLNGQPLDDLASKIALYREARERHGHDPRAGKITVMLHTFLQNTMRAAVEKAREPLTNYLRTFIGQSSTIMAKSSDYRVDGMTEDDREVLVSYAFENYVQTSSLLGTPDTCARMIDRLRSIGVNEVACLIDFGLDLDAVLDGLHYLNELRSA